MADTLVQARAAYQRRDWRGARAGFAAARAEAELDPEDLSALADAVWWLGDTDECLALSEEVYRRHLHGARVPRAARLVPALDGVADRLRAGGRVADVGCGYGTSSVVLAQAFSEAAVSGFDAHPASVEAARQAAAGAGVSDRVTVEVAEADAFPGGGYDLVCMFNAIHEMGDPVAVAAHARAALTDRGSVLIIEPNAGDRVEDNRTPIGRNFYSVSTMVCVPSALSQGAASVLGAHAGEAALRDVLTRAGFTTVRRVAETPMVMALEAKP